jgi:hypothetical protein
VNIKGVKASQKADDLSLTASTDQKTTLGTVKFSVVSVTIDWTASGPISGDNSAKSDFFSKYKPSPGVGSSQTIQAWVPSRRIHFSAVTQVFNSQER